MALADLDEIILRELLQGNGNMAPADPQMFRQTFLRDLEGEDSRIWLGYMEI